MKKRLFLVVSLIALMLSSSGCYMIGANEVGVDTKLLGYNATDADKKALKDGTASFWLKTKDVFLPMKGVQPEPMYAGLHVLVPYFNRVTIYDTKLQTTEFVGARHDLLFKTIDGNDVSLDVVINWKVDEKMAPYIRERVAKNNRELEEVIVYTVTRSRPRDLYGELTTEEFYDAKKRDEKTEKALEEVNKILNDYGVIVTRISTKNYKFSDAYTLAIAGKIKADQEEQRLKSELKAKKEEYVKKVNEAVGYVNELTAKADGNYNKAVIDADAYYDACVNKAKGIRAMGEAEAEGMRNMNNALASEGGKYVVMLEAAKYLNASEAPITIVPSGMGGLDVKTTDVNKLIQDYGTKKIIDDAKKK